LHSKTRKLMEKEKEDIVQKHRSSPACIRDGYQLYTTYFRQIFRQTWLVALVFALFSTVASAMPVLISPSLLLAGLALAIIAVILLLYAANRRMRHCTFFQPVGKITFPMWFRHLGMLFLVLFVGLLIVFALSMITSLPTTIMMAANWESKIGMLSGDPIGMPSYVKWLSLVAFLIAGFIQAYVWMTLVCPLYLTRVSIVKQEQERKEFNAKI